LEWRQDYDKAVQVDDPFAEIIAGEGNFEGKLARFGHGFQRSYLLALLQELSGSSDASGPRLILGVEEPELYQHPPQARHLAEVLKDLATKNSQVMVCTHSPYFVSGEGFEDVRMIRKNRSDSAASVAFVTFEDLAKTVANAKGETHVVKLSGVLSKINQELQPHINEIFFTPFLILVEGLEDVAYLTTYLNLMGKWDEYRRFGCHMVATNGKSLMIQPLGIVRHLKIPTFVVFDSDADKPDRNGSRVRHEKDNSAILKLRGIAAPDPMPADTLWAENVVMWKSDIASIVQGDIPAAEFIKHIDHARKNCGQVEGLEKNSIFVAEWLTLAWQAGHKSPTLERLCNEILRFAASVPTVIPPGAAPIPVGSA
jgi:predicted ATP-dependent endonuclease of OLD family